MTSGVIGSQSSLSDYHQEMHDDAMRLKDNMLLARGEGLTYQEIAELFDVSRQRVHQILTGYRSPATHASLHDPIRKAKRKRTVKQVVLAHYGNGKVACVKCGFSDIRALSIDHINGDGWKDRAKSNGNTFHRGGSGMYYYLRRNSYPEGYQTLCMNCQFIKRETRQEYRRY